MFDNRFKRIQNSTLFQEDATSWSATRPYLRGKKTSVRGRRKE